MSAASSLFFYFENLDENRATQTKLIWFLNGVRFFASQIQIEYACMCVSLYEISAARYFQQWLRARATLFSFELKKIEKKNKKNE